MASVIDEKTEPNVARVAANAGPFGRSPKISSERDVENTDAIEFIQALQKRLDNFEKIVSASFPPLGHLSARQTAPVNEGVAWFEIDVSGFRPYVDIYIDSLCIQTNYNGALKARVKLACFAGETIHITALDPLHSNGAQYSDTLSIRCT